MLGAWKASLSIVQLLALACGKRGSSDDSTPYTLLSSPLASYLCLVFLRRHFSPPSPLWHSLGHLLAVSNRPHLWMAPQFLHSNFQPLCLLGDPHTFTGYVWLWQGLSVILTPFRLPQINCFTFSLKCFSSEQNSCLDIGNGPLLQLPHLLRADPVTLALLFSPLPPLSYRVLCGSIYSFPLARDSCPFSAGVLQALLCLKVYSWCIYGETCTPQPSCSSSRRLSYLSFLFSGTLHSVGFIFFFLPCLLHLFLSQLFVMPLQTTTLPSCISFSLGWFCSPPPIQCYELVSIVLQAQCLPELIPWIYSSPPLYNLKEFDFSHIWMAKLFSLLSSI